MTAAGNLKQFRNQWAVGALLLGSFLAVLPRTGSAQILAPDRFKNGSLVRRAFRRIAAPASRATVQILIDGKQTALGAVVGGDGYILTKSSEVTNLAVVRLADGRQFPARIVRVHKGYDLALLKIAARTPAVVHWSQAADPRLGSWLITTGTNSLPVAVGVVSVRRRTIPRQPGVLGIQIADGDPGPRITRVFANSGAQQAGLKVGDVVTRVAGQVVKSSAALSTRVRLFGPGETLHLTVKRSGTVLEMTARLGYPNTTFNTRRAIQNRMGGRLSNRRADFPAAIQHDTVLRPNDCGGPLVDLSGKVVGINIARAGRTETYAIPTEVIRPLLNDLKSGKLAPRRVPREPPVPPLAELRTN